MNNKRVKIMVDILMVVFMSLSFLRWDDSNFVFHAVVGIACTLAFAAHVFLHRKWIKAVTKSYFKRNLNKTLRGKYAIDVLLLIIWSASIVTGFISVAPFFSESPWAFSWGRFHGVTARIGLVLVVVHAAQHIPQIISYFGVKKQKKVKHEA